MRAEGAGSVAAQQIGALHHHVYASVREPVVWPQRFGVIPPLAGAFQDRAERYRLREAAAVGGTVALMGMGGVGKTQLAVDYAEQTWDSGRGVDLLVWVTASSRDAIEAVFGRAGAKLCGGDPSDPEKAALTFLEWLPSAGRQWLIVLDDVADPTHLRGLWPPTDRLGRTVVTTKRRDAALVGSRRRAIEVGVFSHAEAVAYFASVLVEGGRPEQSDTLAELVEDLGCLPLALSQAAVYVLDAGISVIGYRELLADQVKTLAEMSPDVLPDDQAHSLAAAWELSVDYADRLRPVGLARPMLELAAFLAPNGTPALILTSRPALTHLAAHRKPPSGGTPTETPELSYKPVTATEAIGSLRALSRLSLLTPPGEPRDADEAGTGPTSRAAWDGRVVRVHQVVQRATRDALGPDHFACTARSAGDALLDVWPEVEHDTALVQALRACTNALAAVAEGDPDFPGCLYQPYTHPVLYQLRNSLGQSGQVTAAAEAYRQLAEATNAYFGTDHPDTLTARNNLAHWQGEAGDPAGAAEATANLLDDIVRVLGFEHPITLTTRSNLARWRGEAGDAAGAATAFAELLHDQERILGPNHLSTLTTRHNLADCRGEAGDAAGAATAFAELLHDQERILGPNHPSTLTTRSNLARWRGKAGDPTGAATALAELLHDQARILGPNHPDLLTTRHHLADWRGAEGDAAGAAAALIELLHDQVQILDPNHPRTLTTRHNLAHWRGKAGDAAGAATALAELLHDRLRILGPDHPSTLTTRSNLAWWRGKAGDAAGAATAFAELLHDQARILGPNHPDLLTTRHHLAYWWGEEGGSTEAADMAAELLYHRVGGCLTLSMATPSSLTFHGDGAG